MGFEFGSRQQEALNKAGEFSEHEQHGVSNLKVQMGYSYADKERKHLCYAQLQNHIQAGNALEHMGIGPTLSCQNIWTDKINSLLQVELPYWQDSHQWQLKLNTQFQYILNNQNA